MAIDPPESVLSRMQPKHITFEYCLSFLPLYWMIERLAFLTLFLLLKRIDIVLSSLKSTLRLLSTNQSHIKLKFLSLISISLMSLCWNIRQASSAYKSSSHLTACGVSYIGGIDLRSWGTPHKSFPGSEKVYLNLR